MTASNNKATTHHAKPMNPRIDLKRKGFVEGVMNNDWPD
jgi:hypothetical protein